MWERDLGGFVTRAHLEHHRACLGERVSVCERGIETARERGREREIDRQRASERARERERERNRGRRQGLLAVGLALTQRDFFIDNLLV